MIYKAFSSQEFVDKLIQFHSQEEVKGKDCYDHRKYVLFKVVRMHSSVCTYFLKIFTWLH